MNIFLILIALTLVAFMWLVWMRYNLRMELSQLSHLEELMRLEIRKRRDTIPYLLESFRLTEDVNDAWLKLIQERAAFHKIETSTLKEEWAFELAIQEFITQKRVKNLSYLEAKKDIQDLSESIAKQKSEWMTAINHYNGLRNRFPYSLASAIFGFRAVHL